MREVCGLRGVQYQREPFTLAEHKALQRAQGDARKEFGKERYDEYRYADMRAA